MPVAAQDHHRVGMLVPFQRRIAAGVHFEIAQLAAHAGFLEQHLARDVLERRAAILLVRHVRDAVPAEVVVEVAFLGGLFAVHGLYR